MAYFTEDVSILVINVLINAISLRAFSSNILGSCDVQRRQFGAKTIAKFEESIFVLTTTSGCENSCRKCIKYVRTYKRNNVITKSSKAEDVQDLTNLLIAGSFSIIKATSLGSSVATHSS